MRMRSCVLRSSGRGAALWVKQLLSKSNRISFFLVHKQPLHFYCVYQIPKPIQETVLKVVAELILDGKRLASFQEKSHLWKEVGISFLNLPFVETESIACLNILTFNMTHTMVRSVSSVPCWNLLGIFTCANTSLLLEWNDCKMNPKIRGQPMKGSSNGEMCVLVYSLWHHFDGDAVE